MIYLDNAATTRVCKVARNAMQPYLMDNFGNPSGGYMLAYESSKAVEKAREIIAGSINAKPGEIFFTSGGTESDNWALEGIMAIGKGHMITSKIEHKAILNTCRALEKRGIMLTYLDVNEYGKISLEELTKSINSRTKLISIMFANNEVGTIQNIAEIGKIAKANNVILHTDAVQAFGHIPIDVKKMNIDMLSASGHKFGAPKGTGFLYVNENIDIEPLIFGGGQENGKRGGTENVAGIVAMGAAAKYHHENMKMIMNKEIDMREFAFREIKRRMPDIILNGHKKDRLPGNLSIRIKGVNGKRLVDILSMEGICISAGSACATGKKKPSHVLLALGMSDEEANGTIRITMSYENNYGEIKVFADKLAKAVWRLRSA